MTRPIAFVRHNAIALAALFIALGGTSYAAVAIPKDSVGRRQLRSSAVSASKIKAGAVTPAKLASKSFGGRILDFVEIETDGQVHVSDPVGIKTENWNPNSGGLVLFPRKIPGDCYPLVSGQLPLNPVSGQPPTVGAGVESSTEVEVGVSGPFPVTLAIVCAR